MFPQVARLIRKVIKPFGSLLGVALAVFSVAQPTHAGSVTFGGDGTTAGGDVRAKAIFTTSGNNLTVQLFNLTTDTCNMAQVLTGVRFDVNGSTNGTLISGVGTEAEIGANGSITVLAPKSWGIAPHWALTHTSNPFNLNTIPGAGPGGPYDGIIGPDSSGVFTGTFPHANSSITGNDPHNPLVLGTGTFALTIDSATGFNHTSIANVWLQFGTWADHNLVEIEASGSISLDAPEPASMTLLGIGLMGMAGYGWRRRRQLMGQAVA